MDDKELYQILNSYVELTRNDKEIEFKKLIRQSQPRIAPRKKNLRSNNIHNPYSRFLSYLAYDVTIQSVGESSKIADRRYRNAE